MALAFLLKPLARGPQVEPARTAGIALAEAAPDRILYHSESSGEEAADSTALADAEAWLPPVEPAAVEGAYRLPTPADSGGATVASLPGVGQLALPRRGTGGVQATAAQTQVFGASGKGSQFVYVFDRSASMEGFGGRPMSAAKQELLASLQDLDTVHQFQIVFYNEQPSVFNPFHPQPPRMMFGSDENKHLARRYLGRISPDGGTRHMEALDLALGMKPDVIFFLTDAAEPQLTAGQLEAIRRRNGGQTAIHAIEFGVGPFSGGGNFLQRLARQNRGQHVYVDLSQLASSTSP